MLRHERSAPIWLFSFVDLAFLLLIAFTQISPIESDADKTLAQLEIPRIESPGDPLEGRSPAARWQLRVHAPRTDGTNAFELIAPASRPAGAPSRDGQGPQPTARALAQRIDSGELSTTLIDLFSSAQAKPVLTPHPDARAEDLLVAVGLLSEVWQQPSAVAVIPGAVAAAGPPPRLRSEDRTR